MNEKEKWEAPQILVQKFLPNDYCASSCGTHKKYYFNCNAGNSNIEYAVIKDGTSIRNGNAEYFRSPGSGNSMTGYPDYWGESAFSPCGIQHEASPNSRFISGYYLDNPRTTRNENIRVIIWTGDNDDNVHCTTQLDPKTWDVTRS